LVWFFGRGFKRARRAIRELGNKKTTTETTTHQRARQALEVEPLDGDDVLGVAPSDARAVDGGADPAAAVLEELVGAGVGRVLSVLVGGVVYWWGWGRRRGRERETLARARARTTAAGGVPRRNVSRPHLDALRSLLLLPRSSMLERTRSMAAAVGTQRERERRERGEGGRERDPFPLLLLFSSARARCVCVAQGAGAKAPIAATDAAGRRQPGRVGGGLPEPGGRREEEGGRRGREGGREEREGCFAPLVAARAL
jgi:hypothetical protein